MVLYLYPIDTNGIRTFQNFLWKDMPGALLPDDPNTPAAKDWYRQQNLTHFAFLPRVTGCADQC